ncbi:MAG TPA: trehalose-6-phosphate synthase [Burkholderiaceae bacterium]|nr:trehalose-6-phosphate synthase [Burkholderiaceae bacterium]
MLDPHNPKAGGLAVALGDMMHGREGLWLGWSGEEVPEGSRKITTAPFGRTTLVKVDFTEKERKHYYTGFSNSVLWPVFHEEIQFADLANPEYFPAYEHVNKLLAAELVRHLQDDDMLWIHDYHLIPLAKELRALGCSQRIGFFNHIPLPPPDVVRTIPRHRQLMESLFSYDLIGMQTARNVKNLHRYIEEEDEGIGQTGEGTLIAGFGKASSATHFPIGIDVASFRALVPSERSEAFLNLMREEAGRQRILMVGVDRLDYSKGVPERLAALRQFLRDHLEMHGRVTFVQVSAPSRPKVAAYVELSLKTKHLVDEINREFETETWKPVIYINEPVERAALPEAFRLSRVGVVTPIADGMNLVAKEYVAAQSPEDPGVLVLSTAAGAAAQMQASLLVNVQNRDEIVAAYESALDMPLQERQERHAHLMSNVQTEDFGWWQRSYLAALDEVPRCSEVPVAISPLTHQTPASASHDHFQTIPR